jgi:hypothetical protein
MVEEGFDARHDYCPEGMRRDAAGWVLDALDAVDVRRFAEHLLTCRACQLTVADLQPAARALLTASALQPPGHLATATIARVRQVAGRTRGSPGNGSLRTGEFHQAGGTSTSERPQFGTAAARGIDKLPGPFHS